MNRSDRIKLNTEMKQLNGINKTTLMNMFRYLSSFSLSEGTFRKIQFDLVGMALENQARSIPLSEVIGNDSQKFCDELVPNCRRKGLVEKILDITFFISMQIAVQVLVWYPLVLLRQFFDTDNTDVIDGVNIIFYFKSFITFYILIFISCTGFGLWYHDRNTYKPIEKTIGKYFLGIIFFSIVLSVIFTIIGNWAGNPDIVVNMPFWVIAMSSCAALSRYLAKRIDQSKSRAL